MCYNCDLREFPPIKRLLDEHEEIANAAGRLRQAIVAGRDDRLTRLDELLALLLPHAAEEHALFARLRDEGGLAEEVARLDAEHTEIHGVLGKVDRTAPDWPAVLTALRRLHRHIDNEEQGLFPAAVVAMPFTAWDRIAV